MTTVNVNSLKQRLKNIANVDVKDALIKATEIVHSQAKNLAPVDTGNLAGSIHMKVIKTNEGLIGKVFTNLSYAPYVEFGTGIIGNGTYPYHVKGLKLSYKDTPWVYTPDGGDNFYFSKGQAAQPYMYPALKENEKYIKQLFKDAVKDAIRKGK